METAYNNTSTIIELKIKQSADGIGAQLSNSSAELAIILAMREHYFHSDL